MYYDANAQKFILMSNVYNYYSPVEKDLIVEDVCNLEDVDECDWPEMKYFTTFKSEDELLSSVNYLRILNKAISLVDCSRLNKPNIAFERYCYENGINNKESIDEKFIELLKNSNFIEMKRRQPDRLENKVGIEVEILKLKGTNKSIIVYNNKRSNYCFIYEDESDESKPKNLPVEMIHCELSLGHLILLAYSIGGWLKNTNIEESIFQR